MRYQAAPCPDPVFLSSVVLPRERLTLDQGSRGRDDKAGFRASQFDTAVFSEKSSN
jgi:hypothetical protein